MVKLQDLKTLAEGIKNADGNISEVIFCVDDTQAVNKLKDKRGVVLIVLYPEAEANGQQDAAVDNNATWLFVLEKLKAGQKEAEEFAQMEKLQNIVLAARSFIDNNYHQPGFCFLRRYMPGSSSIIPEYNQFGGYNGWSMSLTF